MENRQIHNFCNYIVTLYNIWILLKQSFLKPIKIVKNSSSLSLWKWYFFLLIKKAYFVWLKSQVKTNYKHRSILNKIWFLLNFFLNLGEINFELFVLWLNAYYKRALKQRTFFVKKLHSVVLYFDPNEKLKINFTSFKLFKI